jgi:hypothetical protein
MGLKFSPTSPHGWRSSRWYFNPRVEKRPTSCVGVHPWAGREALGRFHRSGVYYDQSALDDIHGTEIRLAQRFFLPQQKASPKIT